MNRLVADAGNGVDGLQVDDPMASQLFSIGAAGFGALLTQHFRSPSALSQPPASARSISKSNNADP